MGRQLIMMKRRILLVVMTITPVSDFRSRRSVDNSKSDPLRRLDDLPLLASVGGTTLKIWNPFNGSCLGAFAIRHAKTFTSMCLLDIPDDDNDNEEEESKENRKRHPPTPPPLTLINPPPPH